jgi:hypothetical protein
MAPGSLVVENIHHVTCQYCIAAANDGWSDVVCNECGVKTSNLPSCVTCPACDSDDTSVVSGTERSASVGEEFDPAEARLDRIADDADDNWRDEEGA